MPGACFNVIVGLTVTTGDVQHLHAVFKIQMTDGFPEPLVVGILHAVVFLHINIGHTVPMGFNISVGPGSFCHVNQLFRRFMMEIWSASKPMKKRNIPRMTRMTALLANRPNR